MVKPTFDMCTGGLVFSPLRMSFPHFLWTWLVVKWVKFLFNQGPDPSLVYRPDVDPEMAKSKDSFRNYTVSDSLTFSAFSNLWSSSVESSPSSSRSSKGAFFFPPLEAPFHFISVGYMACSRGGHGL